MDSSLALVTNGNRLFVYLVILAGAVIYSLVNRNRRRRPSSAIVNRLAQMERQLFGGLHVFRDATDADFRDLDRAFYETTTRELTALGFRSVKDAVNETTEAAAFPRNHSVQRYLLGDNGSIMATIYHVRLYGFGRALQTTGAIARNLKTVECETALSDGTFVSTSNTAQSDKSAGYPFVDRQQFPSTTSAFRIVQAHREHLKSVLAARGPQVSVLRCTNYGEMRDLQDRQHLLKIVFRNSPDFDFAREFESIRGRPLRESDRALAAGLTDELHPPIPAEPMDAPRNRAG